MHSFIVRTEKNRGTPFYVLPLMHSFIVRTEKNRGTPFYVLVEKELAPSPRSLRVAPIHFSIVHSLILHFQTLAQEAQDEKNCLKITCTCYPLHLSLYPQSKQTEETTLAAAMDPPTPQPSSK
ncbi:hypothetical protein KP509_04G054300 [Ceratopteris richardii]|uniref:Uncharacterized protein n=1 Tax=Ceratopteris richardii TaxID=49495 RepID=A0A8T2UST9_CERRI|nr:hypothetical protein KP509_04G054300 [Ceratopteris richardii]